MNDFLYVHQCQSRWNVICFYSFSIFPVDVRMCGQNKRDVNCFHKIFAKIGK